MAGIVLRPPSFSPAKAPAEYSSPNIAWLTETWHVTHSTLPMWKDKRNIRIKYTPLPASVSSISVEYTDRMDDEVSYQSLKDEKIQTVHGVDKLASSGDARDAWDWHGRGWLMLAGKLAHSHWEILGWGDETGTGNKWVVTMFAKTLFTPAGIDVYSKGVDGLRKETVRAIKDALANIEDQNVQKMAVELFDTTLDSARR
ncbi:hypothetical protein BAUCODRAFT_36543 [Baudoinia panamericana UAMH 10762]|uniref:Uncharacterized protein n=1 Tax=Baudoinia panamericana (strain UAMH 10762) TaxID=717646 RepID=M2N4X5_BAUPA|nr:uncharacterized protein BAUCODRAFT_36543 [Baudoinia panamericana UAMH 10762]EMC94069.1 hypothetical protein BAUCODRAFT_36543 [Baudoinia panamericana UAMH 10762]